MNERGSLHGMIVYGVGETLWEVATAIGDGLAVYGRDLQWVDKDVPRARVRVFGGDSESGWARYEPDYGEAMMRLLDRIGQHGVPVSLPYKPPDAVGLALLSEVNTTAFLAAAVNAYADGNQLGTQRGMRRLGETLSRWSMHARWCCLHNLADRDGPDVFLTREETVIDAVAPAVPGKPYRW